ncbi:MAG TPA: right-handed parallel beta-helix repeat-containing protein [Humisphaera sp.]|nr:right-handed parallel beta-helix repeat-containing protein [Humisphaera sp.]
MPRLSARARGLTVANRTRSDKARRTTEQSRNAQVWPSNASGLVETLERRTLLSTSWFVAPTGSDQNPGTLAAPFKTIQQAAAVAQAGDHVEIRAGTYHETVTPAHSGTTGAPITFEAYNNEAVFVSGADPVVGWSSYSGSIYQASMPWTLGEGSDQVFVDGQMINEARWPNTSLDPSHPTLEKASKVSVNGSTATLYDPKLTQPANYWKGAIIHITPGQEWVAETGTVIGSAPGQITFSFNPMDSYEQPAAGNHYYLTGSFKALDSAGEWYHDSGSEKLYVWTPKSDSPAAHDIEVKHRQYAFDLRGDSFITIQNVNIFAATILTDAASSNAVINQIGAKYIGQFLFLPHGWDIPSNTGIVLAGDSSIFENSTIAFGAGDGVLVSGSNSRVTNNVIHDVDYNAADTAGIRILAGGTGSQIDHNTIYNAGRSGIVHSAAHVKILYNAIHDVGIQTTEAGGIYTVNTDGQGTEIAYNKVYNMHSGGFGQTGLFLDNNSDNFVVDHNQVWNVDHALKLNFTCRDDNIYNNTLNGTLTSVLTNKQGDWDGTTLTHNVFVTRTVFNSGAKVANNSTAVTPGVGAGDFISGASSSTVDASPPPTTGSGSSSSGSGSSGTGSTTGSGSTTGTGSTGSGSTTGGGSTTGTGTDSGNDGSGSSTPTPPPPPTIGEYPALLAADRASIKAAKLARAQALKNLASTLRSDTRAYRAALHQLKTVQRVARAALKHGGAVPTDMSTLSTDVQTLQQTLANDRAALVSAKHSDLTGIDTAHAQLVADQKAYRQLKQG